MVRHDHNLLRVSLGAGQSGFRCVSRASATSARCSVSPVTEQAAAPGTLPRPGWPRRETIAAEYAGQLNVVGVGGLGESVDIRDFAREVDGPTHLIDQEGAIWRHFGVTAQSTYVLLDADGAVVGQGYLDNEVLSAQVAELVD